MNLNQDKMNIEAADKINLEDKPGFDFNGILVAFNFIIFSGIFIFYSLNEFPKLVDGITLSIYVLLFAQMQFFLYYEKRHRNPFILVLGYVITFFFFPRIITLYWTDVFHYSGVLNRLRPATVNDVNHTLVFMLLANVFIFLGLIYTRNSARRKDTERAPIKVPKSIKIIIILMAIILYVFFVSFINPLVIGKEQRILSYLGILLNPYLLLPFAIIYLIISSEIRKPKKFLIISKRSLSRLWMGILFLVLVSLGILSGSRSALLTIMQIGFFTLLAMGLYKIPKKILFITALVLVLSVPLFIVATYSRISKSDQGVNFSFGVQQEQVYQQVSAASQNLDIIHLLVPVFDRMAFLDFSVDLMKNSEEYGKVVNVWHYFKSTVDALTPGFDVFDCPKSANALAYIYYGIPEQMKRQGNFYQSDQFNVYGEYYVAFGGWLSLPVFFLAALGFKAVYLRINVKRFLASIVWKYFVIMLFFNWVISFGTDWQITYGLYQFVGFYLLLVVIDKTWVFSYRCTNSESY